MKVINRTVWILSFVSLLADVASEMLYPVIPIYLKEIGFSIFLIGVLEGVANFTAGLTKGYFGKLSDERGYRLPFIKWGYFLSAISKPMTAFFTWPAWVFFARTTDRLGKGIRTAARDAVLAENATNETSARVFGLHRAMDTLGAAIGPCVALLLLYLFPHQYKMIFYLAFIPGMLSILLLFLLKEQRRPKSTLGKGSFFSYFRYWNIASNEYKRIVIALLFFSLFNSADVFLLLRAREISGSDTTTIAAYILYNVVFALASYPLGALADRIGIKTVFIAGLILFAVVYFIFGITNSVTVIFAGFFLYGIYAAATEGLSKAWISNLSKTDTATALGFFTSTSSICTFLASVIAGALWTSFGSATTFLITAVSVLPVMIYLALKTR
jgi:MFS family permease